MNGSCAAEPTMMLGGSPIRVAAPPMFEAMITGSRYTLGSSPSRAATPTAIGVTKITVVTLSRNADAMPVAQMSTDSTAAGLAGRSPSNRPTDHSNTPVALSTPTTAIIPASRKRTLRSSAAWAASKEIRW